MHISHSIVQIRSGIPLVGALLLLAACGDPNAPLTISSPGEKTRESVYQEQAPQARAVTLTRKLNDYRAQTYNAFNGVAHRNVLYTEAYRHAVYLNSLNSQNWDDKKGRGADSKTITANSSLATLANEPFEQMSPGFPWPALYTASEVLTRASAVVGSPDLFDGVGNGNFELQEHYLFNGDAGTEFRSFPSEIGIYDPVDSVWYQRHGRLSLARGALKYYGFASALDGGLQPPFPILNGRFRGVMTTMTDRSGVALEGYWPHDGSVVTPFGLDTDIGGPTNYPGLPIHVSLPVDEPFLAEGGVVKMAFYRSDGTVPQVPLTNRFFKAFSNVEGLTIPINFIIGAPFYFGTGDPAKDGEYRIIGTPAPFLKNVEVVSFKSDFYINNFKDRLVNLILNPAIDIKLVASGDKVVIKVKGDDRTVTTTILADLRPLFGTAGNFQVGVDANNHRIDVSMPDDPDFQFLNAAQAASKEITVDIISTTHSGIAADLDMKMKNGELVIVPVAPLENNAKYKVELQLKTPGYSWPLHVWEFTTNNNNLNSN